MARTFTVIADNDTDLVYAIEEALREFKNGYKSGVEPEWDVEGYEEFEEERINFRID